MPFTGYHHGSRLREDTALPVLVRVAQSAVVGLIGTAPDADAAVFPLNVPVLLPGSPAMAADLGDTGTLKNAVDAVFAQAYCNTVVIRVEDGADTAATLSNVVGDPATRTGIHAFLNAESQTGIRPRILAAPGFTASDGVSANPAAAALPAVLDDLRAVAFVDGPDTTNADALAARAMITSQRIQIVDPKVSAWDEEASAWVLRPASAYFAGVMAKVDQERGFWHAHSNKPINGIGGVSRAILYPKETNLLNAGEVACVTTFGAGFKTWGSRGCGDVSLWAFLCVRRTADFINEAIERAMLEFVDRPFSDANLRLMLAAVNSALAGFEAEGAILGGEAWLTAEDNAPDQLAAGRVRLRMKFEPPAPMEDIGVTAHRALEYYVDLVQGVLSAST